MSNHDRKGPGTSERDVTLEQAWHQASNEQPPSRLDAAILAAAREAVGKNTAHPQTVRARSRSWLTQWQPVAAAAAVTGLAFVLLQMLPRDRGVAPSMQIEAPALDVERIVPPPAAAPPAATGRQSTNSATRYEAVTERASAAAAAEVDQRDATAPNAPTAAASAGMAAPASAAKQSAAPSMSAADWAARVSALYGSGDIAQAADALRAFRATYPDADAYLSESLRDWAQTIE